MGFFFWSAVAIATFVRPAGPPFNSHDRKVVERERPKEFMRPAGTTVKMNFVTLRVDSWIVNVTEKYDSRTNTK